MSELMDKFDLHWLPETTPTVYIHSSSTGETNQGQTCACYELLAKNTNWKNTSSRGYNTNATQCKSAVSQSPKT